MNRLSASLLTLLAVVGQATSQSIVPAEWKFLTGDKQEYIDSARNDYWWNDISPLSVWEKQGFQSYDGYAWYRVKVVVPVSMKKNALKYGGLRLSLGKIDDADETWFNGHMIGATGKMPPDYAGAWDVPRSYLVPPEYVRWGGKNTIAVRVYDAGGDGGLWGGPVELTNRGNPDLLTPGTAFDVQDNILKGSPDTGIPVTIKSELRKKYRGALTLKIDTDFGEKFYEEFREVAVKKLSTGRFVFRIRDLKPGFTGLPSPLKARWAARSILSTSGMNRR